MTEVAVEPHVLFAWAHGPVNTVAEDVTSAFTTLTGDSEAGGLAAARDSSSIAATLAAITDHEGAWGRDARFTRGRIDRFAGALINAGNGYAGGDDGNSVRISDAAQQPATVGG